MTIVIPKPYAQQTSYKKPKQTGLASFWKRSPDVAYSAYNNLSESGAEILTLSVNPGWLKGTEATPGSFRITFTDDVSISRTRALTQLQNVNKSLVSPGEALRSPAVISEAEDILDWDFYLKNPPLKPTSTIELEFEYGGRSKPIPVVDPWDE